MHHGGGAGSPLHAAERGEARGNVWSMQHTVGFAGSSLPPPPWRWRTTPGRNAVWALNFGAWAYFTGVTVLEVIKRGAEFLDKKGVESPRLQVELLLAHVLHLSRTQLYVNFEKVVEPAELQLVRELIKRRGQREPLQHITGSTSFCGLEIAVNRNVLIPRPETEELAELAWTFLNGVAAEVPTALDFGTGSGCLAIALAVKAPKARIQAVDISPEALAVAGQNAARHQIGGRIQFLAGDGLQAVAAGTGFDLIVANPPYIPSGEIASLEPEVRDHDPRLALDGGAEGLDFYRRLASGAGPWLRPGGRIMLEFGDGQAEPIRGLFEAQMWIVERVKTDYHGPLRVLIARRAG